MDTLKNLAIKLQNISTEIETIRVELYNNKDFKSNFVDEVDFERIDDELFSIESKVAEIANIVSADYFVD